MADEFIPFPLFVGFALAIAGFNFWRQHQRAQGWAAWAAQKGFTAAGGSPFRPPDLSGKRGGVPVAVVVESRRSGKNSYLVAVVRATVSAHLPRGLHVRREVLMDGVAKLIGEQDIRIGDPWLDSAVMVQADAPADAVRGLLSQPEVRVALRKLFEAGAAGTFLLGERAVRVHDGEVVMELRTLDIERVDAAIRVTAEAARALAVAAGAGSDVLGAPEDLGSLDAQRGARRYTVQSTAAARQKALPPGDAPATPPAPPPQPFVGGAGRTLAWPDPPTAPPPPPEAAAAPPPPTPALAPPLPEAPRSPPAPAPEAPTPGSPHWAGVQAFRDRRVPLGEKDAALRALGASPCAGVLTVERVDWTSGLRVGPGLDGGRTVIGALDALPGPVALRFPARDNAAVDALARGARLAVTAQIVGWDELFERVLLELDPSIPGPLVAPGR